MCDWFQFDNYYLSTEICCLGGRAETNLEYPNGCGCIQLDYLHDKYYFWSVGAIVCDWWVRYKDKMYNDLHVGAGFMDVTASGMNTISMWEAVSLVHIGAY